MLLKHIQFSTLLHEIKSKILVKNECDRFKYVECRKYSVTSRRTVRSFLSSGATKAKQIREYSIIILCVQFFAVRMLLFKNAAAYKRWILMKKIVSLIGIISKGSIKNNSIYENM